MPKIIGEEIGIAFDMEGCPNLCRHCWLGTAGNQKLSEADVRWGTSLFRDYVNETDSSVRNLAVSTHFREPDFRDDYRQMYDLEAELGDGKPSRFELLSIWRLARDESYASWAKSVGPDTCQISFFGMQETTDWFCRRRGAFDDAVKATEVLLDSGMNPRWQIFLTTKLLPELEDLLTLRDKIGGSAEGIQIFLNLPGPEGEAEKIELLRPTIDQVFALPDSLLEISRKHIGESVLWRTEGELCTSILSFPDVPETLPEQLWFFICGNWDVFSNIGTLEPWWCLGNLKKDSVETIIRRFENDELPGLKVLCHLSPSSLVEEFGNFDGRKIYSSRECLLSLYREKLCRREWRR